MQRILFFTLTLFSFSLLQGQTIVNCGDTWFDSGGATLGYTNNEDIDYQMCPDNAGDVVTVTFSSFNTESGWDYLKVYNGDSDSAPQLHTGSGFSGSSIPGPFTSTDASGCLFFNFDSDGSSTDDGWEASVTCGQPPSPPSNNDCANATSLTVEADLLCSSPIAGTTENATETVPACAGNIAQGVWYSFMATGTAHTIIINNTSGSTDIVTEVFDACGGTSITCQDIPNSPIELTGLTMNTVYYFMIYDYQFSGTPAVTNFEVCVGTPPTCPDPSNLSISSITSSSANYSWTTGGSASSFLIEACPNSAPAGDASCITTDVGSIGGPVTLSGLMPMTSYDAYITEDCGGGDLSNVVGPQTFTTLALPPSNDDCANALSLSVDAVGNCTPVTIDHSTATDDGAFSCDSGTGNIGTWYTFEAPSTGSVIVMITNGSQVGTAEGELFDACSGSSIICSNSINGSTLSGLTSGVVYTLAIWYDSFNSEGDFDICLEAGCGISDIQSVSNTVCTDNLYDASIEITYANAPLTGMLEVTVGTITQQFAITSSPQTVIVEDCIADGLSTDVSVEFTVNGTCSMSSTDLFTAPDACACSISDITDPGNGVMNCDDNGGSNGTYDYQVEVTYSFAPSGEALNITAGSGSGSIPSPMSGAGPHTELVTIVGVPLDGSSQSVTAEFATSNTCTYTEPGVFVNPSFCEPPLPVCGGKFFDPGGEFNDYGNNDDEDYLICPDNAGDVVTITFNTFNTESGFDYLTVYDGDDNSAPALHTGSGFSGTTAPGPFISTAASGCLFFNFDSDGSAVREGWDADVTCDPPPNCPDPSQLSVASITSSSADYSWNTGGSAIGFIVEACPNNAPSGDASCITTMVGTIGGAVTLSGLSATTAYDAYITEDCDNGDFSNPIGPISFTTLADPPSNDDCANALLLSVDAPGNCSSVTINHAAATDDGFFTCDDFGANIGTWYTFEAPSTGSVVVMISNGSQTGTAEGELFDACSGTSILCDNTIDNATLSGLTSGVVYTLAIWYDDSNTEGDFDICLEAGCALSDIQSISNSACADNLFDATLEITYENAPASGMLEVTVSGVSQQFAITSSPQTVIVEDCIADGLSADVSAEFTDNNVCALSSTALFTAPDRCSCSISDISDPGNGVMNCDDNGGSNGTYDYQVEVTYSFAPSGEALNVTAGSGTGSIASPMSGSGPHTETVTIVGVSLNGFSQSVTAEFATSNTCTYTESNVFVNPDFCEPPIPVCGGKFFDPSGEFNNYENNQDVDYLICPDNAGDAVVVTFIEFNTESGYDYLTVYNGDDDSAPALHGGSGFSGTSIPGPFTSTATSGCLFFNFDSDGSQTRTGWEADVTCAPCDATSNVVLAGSTMTLTTANTCNDASTGFTYYSDGGDSYQFAIDWDPTNIGGGHNSAAKDNVSITITTATPGTETSATEGTWTMDRFWNVSTGGNALDGDVSIRFYYDPTEKSGTDGAAVAANGSNGWPLETSAWFKTVNVDFDPANITPTAVGQGAIDLTSNIVSDGNTENGVTYVEFQNITSFSGGTYAAGAGTAGASVLPLRLISFDAYADDEVNRVTWITASEINVDFHLIEKSIDGQNWVKLGSLKAYNEMRETAYELIDIDPSSTSYYRLSSQDYDGAFYVSATTKVLRKGDEDSVLIRPMPFNNKMYIDLSSKKSDRVTASFIDMTGRLIRTQVFDLNKGSQTVELETSTLQSGIYVLRLEGDSFNSIQKVVKQ